MPDYNKFSDKFLLSQPRAAMDEEAGALYDFKTKEEVSRIVERYRDNPAMLRDIAVGLGQKVLITQQPKTDDITNYD